MPRKGFANITIAEQEKKVLQMITKREFCQSEPEAFRLLIREYLQKRGIDIKQMHEELEKIAEKSKNAFYGVLTRDLTKSVILPKLVPFSL
jgi:hypothetical protein